MKKGMTLVEILVSLTILMIILGAIFSILNLQQTKAVDVQSTTILQTEANVAMTLLRWDLFMAGYGIATENVSIISNDNATPTNSDNITLHGAGLAFTSKRANWSPILEAALTSSEIKIFRFTDADANLKVGDTISIVDQNKLPLDSNLVIDASQVIWHVAGEESVPGLKLTLDRTVNVGMGAIAIVVDHDSYYNGVTYTLNNGNLMRGNEVFLEDVEDIQFAYGIDENNNGTFEPGEWWNNLTDNPNYTTRLLYEHKSAIRSSFVITTSRFLSDYTYPFDSLVIENHIYYPTEIEKKKKREIVTAISWPRNLQF